MLTRALAWSLLRMLFSLLSCRSIERLESGPLEELVVHQVFSGSPSIHRCTSELDVRDPIVFETAVPLSPSQHYGAAMAHFLAAAQCQNHRLR